MVKSNTPRLFINKNETIFSQINKHRLNFICQIDCDQACSKLADLLGWSRSLSEQLKGPKKYHDKQVSLPPIQSNSLIE